MPEIPEGHKRLAEAIDERRLELGLRWSDLTERGGPSGEWLRSLRRGDARDIRYLTRARIAKALGWQRSYVDGLLAAGMQPEPLDDRPAIVREHWDDDDVRKIWELRAIPADAKAGLVGIYLTHRAEAAS